MTAVVLAGCLWLAATPPRWLAGDRHGRRFGVAGALVMAAGFVLVSRLEQRDTTLDAGIISNLLLAAPAVVLAGSVAAAVAGRSFRSGAGRLRLGHRAGRAAGDRGLAGRGAALVQARSRAAPGRRRGRDGANLSDAI